MSKLFINEINGLNKVAHSVMMCGGGAAVCDDAQRPGAAAAACISHQRTLSLYLHEVMDEMHHWAKRAHAIATLALANEVEVADIAGEAAPGVPPHSADLGW